MKKKESRTRVRTKPNINDNTMLERTQERAKSNPFPIFIRVYVR